MNKASVIHESKSRYSYMYDETTLHLRIKTEVNDIKNISVLAVDPFNWGKGDDGNFSFDTNSIKVLDMQNEGETMYHEVWFVEVKNIDTLRIRYTFLLTDSQDEKYIFGCSGIWKLTQDNMYNVYDYFNFPYLNKEDMYKSPEWTKNAVWYQITATAFSQDGNTPVDNTSGNFSGLVKKLDYIQEMGFTAIYFTPIFEGLTWHLYDTTDYFNVSKKLGGNKAFKEFMNEAHKRGIKVMLDGVFNHCGSLHPFWQDVIKNGKNSRYYDCFFIIDDNKPIIQTHINDDGTYEDIGGYNTDMNVRTFAYTLNMPKLNTDNPIMQDYLIKVGKFWVEEFGIDGWRLDVSNEVSHKFWRRFREEIKAVKEDVYIMGENWDDSYSWLQGDQFDSVMNYGVMNNVVGFLKPNQHKYVPLTANEYRKSLTELYTRYPKNVTESMFNLIDSHDTDRVTNIFGDDRIIKLAYVLQMTYGGSPCVYYGDEIGLTGGELNNRIPMVWEENKQNMEIKNHIKKLIDLRKSSKSIASEDIKWLCSDDNTNTLLYKKSYINDEDIYICVHNKNVAEIFNLPDELKNIKVIDIYNNKDIELEEQIVLKAYQFLVLKKAEK